MVGYDGHAEKYLHVVRLSSGSCDRFAQCAGGCARRILVGRGDEDAFGMTGGKLPTATGGTGLIENRRALHRRLGEVIAL